MTARFRSKSIASALASGLTAFAITGTARPCAAQAQPARPATAAPAQAPARTVAPPPVVAAPGINLPPEYTIGADDVLSIVFWRDKELTAEVTVRPDGKISLPLLNDIQASGLTPAQLKDRIVEESKKYVEDPNVTVVVKDIKSRKVYITGEVRKPGFYPLTSSTTVLQMISIAGGLADYAKPDKISVVRVENGKSQSFKFNYKEIIEGKKLTQNIELKPGDTIIVP
jgi:polysaccharide export outer membrane protein